MTLEITETTMAQNIFEPSLVHSDPISYLFPNYKIGIVIPAFNEMYNIRKVIMRIPKNISSLLQIIVVNDGSSDKTSQVVEDTEAILLNHESNIGYGAAVRTGFNYCIKQNMDVIVTLDADGQHDPIYLADIIRPIIEGEVDFTIGNRHEVEYIAGNPYKKVFSKLMSGIYSLLFLKKISDPTNGFRAFSFRLLKNMEFESNYTITQEILFKIVPKYDIKQIPLKVHGRLHGNSFIRVNKYLKNTIIAFYKFFLRH